MADLVIRGAKLFPASRADGSPSYATAFIYEPEPAQQKFGELYAVVEILSSSKDPEAVADLIIESFGRAFYAESEASEEQDDSESGSRFDQAVKATNQALSRHTNEADATWIGKTSAVIAVAAGNELHITHTGSSEAYLCRKGRLSRIDANTGDARHQTHKPFTSVASGHLEAADRILLSTPALTRILSKEELSSLLANGSANAAANKIAEKIETQMGAERVAAVVAEVSTAEIISEQPLPSEPHEVAHGRRDSWLSNAKQRAVPALKHVHSRAKPLAAKTAKAAGRGWHFTKTKVAPKAKHHGLKAASWLRHKLRDPKKARIALAVSAAALLLFGFLFVRAISGAGQAKLIKSYDQALTTAREGQQLWLDGDKAGAQQKLEAAQQQMEVIIESNPDKKFDDALAKRDHPDYDPASVSGLSSLIQDLLDQIAGLTRVSANEVANLGDIKDRQPSFAEFSGGRIVIVGGTDSPVIASIDPANGKVTQASADTKPVGKVIDTAASSSGDGVYILTSKPEVWLFRPSNGSLTKQSGSWQSSKSIASYAGNIYLLKSDNSQILRYTPSGTGFAEPDNYLAANQSARLTGATTLAVDGSVITAGGSKLLRFFTGTLAQTASGTPDGFDSIKQAQSIADGDILLALTGSGRIGTYGFDGDSIEFTKQYALTAGPNIKAIAPVDDIRVYALYEDKIVSMNLVP